MKNQEITYEYEHLWWDTYKVTKITKESFIVRSNSAIKEIYHNYENMPEIKIENEQEFNQFVKDNNLDILNWKSIAKMLFIQDMRYYKLENKYDNLSREFSILSNLVNNK